MLGISHNSVLQKDGVDACLLRRVRALQLVPALQLHRQRLVHHLGHVLLVGWTGSALVQVHVIALGNVHLHRQQINCRAVSIRFASGTAHSHLRSLRGLVLGVVMELQILRRTRELDLVEKLDPSDAVLGPWSCVGGGCCPCGARTPCASSAVLAACATRD